MKILYPICIEDNDYRFGKTDVDESDVENCCSEKCIHANPVEASDCYREKLLKKKPSIVSIESRKCCSPKCPNEATDALNYGYDFQFPLCKDHQDKASVRKVCGFGFPLILHDC